MKKIISYEKDIIFKTNIGEICSISLEHDFTVDDGFLRGEFILNGDYKPNELSLNRESFEHRLPLEYELEENVDLPTLSYDIDNFEYTVDDDILSVYIDFGVRYDEKKIEPVIPEITEEELNLDDFSDIGQNDYERNSEEEVLTEVEPEELNPFEADIDVVIEDDADIRDEEIRLEDEEKDMILESTLETDEFITYHVHIVREGDTFESISSKYNCSLETIKEYNNIEALEIKSKLIIPDSKDE